MDIYSSTKNYRKIWVHYNGPIPKDEKGRSYEIHHIDGNRKNNHISNLKCVSIQEHYEIHKSQGDGYACLRIAEKMKLSPEELSAIASEASIQVWADPEHRAYRTNINKEIGNREDVKKARSKNAKLLWADPIFRAKQEQKRKSKKFRKMLSKAQKKPETQEKRRKTEAERNTNERRSIASKSLWENDQRRLEAAERTRQRNLNEKPIYCEHCDVTIKGRPAWGRHIRSKKHAQFTCD